MPKKSRVLILQAFSLVLSLARPKKTSWYLMLSRGWTRWEKFFLRLSIYHHRPCSLSFRSLVRPAWAVLFPCPPMIIHSYSAIHFLPLVSKNSSECHLKHTRKLPNFHLQNHRATYRANPVSPNRPWPTRLLRKTAEKSAFASMPWSLKIWSFRSRKTVKCLPKQPAILLSAHWERHFK